MVFFPPSSLVEYGNLFSIGKRVGLFTIFTPRKSMDEGGPCACIFVRVSSALR